MWLEARFYEEQGYRAHIEEPVNAYADLVVERGDERPAIEIETVMSNWKDNIARDLGKDVFLVMVVCTNEQAYMAIRTGQRSAGPVIVGYRWSEPRSSAHDPRRATRAYKTPRALAL